jgi:hypothetical protein
MFVLLEHRCGDDVHWDFMIEHDPDGRLPTWRLEHNPVGRADPIRATRIGEHRRVYLDYEGPISGDRGDVHRIDRGPAQILEMDDRQLLIELAGERLRGLFELLLSEGDNGLFRRLSPGPPPG